MRIGSSWVLMIVQKEKEGENKGESPSKEESNKEVNANGN